VLILKNGRKKRMAKPKEPNYLESKYKPNELDLWASKCHRLHISYGQLQAQETSELLRHDERVKKRIAEQMI
jgi:hypothetical protein